MLFEGHPSWRSTLGFYLKGVAGAVLAAAIVLLASAVSDVGTGFIIPVVVGYLAAVIIVGYLRRIATTYTITNRRLHIKRGIVARATQEARLERVQNVNTDQSALERILKVGTVDFDTAGGDDHDFKFDGVADPSEVVQAVDTAQREAAADPGV